VQACGADAGKIDRLTAIERAAHVQSLDRVSAGGAIDLLAGVESFEQRPQHAEARGD